MAHGINAEDGDKVMYKYVYTNIISYTSISMANDEDEGQFEELGEEIISSSLHH